MEKAVQAVIEIQETSGINAKLSIVKDNAHLEEFRNILWCALNPRITYNVSEATLLQPLPYILEASSIFNDIFEACEFLASKKALDDGTLFQVKLFLQKQPPVYFKLYVQILSKTLRLGITAKNINKVIPDLIPEWDVQQAFPIDK